MLKDKIEDFTGSLGYIALGLALGKIGSVFVFSQLFSFLYYHFLVNNYYPECNREMLEKESQELAWQRCLRIYRGTSGTIKGVCFSKDLMYRQGNIETWEGLEKKPDLYDYYYIGKYNPFSVQHYQWLKSLSILPK